MPRLRRLLIAALTIAAVLVLTSAPLVAAPSLRQGDGVGPGDLVRLLGYVPAPRTGEEYVALSIHYANPASVGRIHGIETRSLEDVPPDVPDDLSPDQLRAREWRRDWQLIWLADTSGREHLRQWSDPFGYDAFSVERSLIVGEPPTSYEVLELAIDTRTVGDKLTALGYASEPAPYGFAGVLFHRYEDYRFQSSDPVSRMTIGKMNRVIVEPGRLITARGTEDVTTPLTAITGQVPSAASAPGIGSVAASLEDPTLIPGTTLLGASVFGLKYAPSSLDPAVVLTPSPPQLELPTQPPLPPYLLWGFGYRRGPDAAQRYWAISLLYPDESVAREAGATLATRIAAYKNSRDGQPLLGGDVVEQLDPTIRTVDDGAILTLRLRLAPDRPASFYGWLSRRDVGFLAPGS